MKKIIEWLFKPIHAKYEHYVGMQVYNRFYYILCILTIIFAFGIIIYDLIIDLSFEISIICVIFLLLMFPINMIQLSKSEFKWKEHCNRLYDNLVKGK